MNDRGVLPPGGLAKDSIPLKPLANAPQPVGEGGTGPTPHAGPQRRKVTTCGHAAGPAGYSKRRRNRQRGGPPVTDDGRLAGVHLQSQRGHGFHDQNAQGSGLLHDNALGRKHRCAHIIHVT